MSGESGRQRAYRSRTGPRAMQACQSCAASKTKCDNDRHCRRCVKRKIPCIRQVNLDAHSSRVDRSDCSAPPSLIELTNSNLSPTYDTASPGGVAHQARSRALAGSSIHAGGVRSISVMASEDGE